MGRGRQASIAISLPLALLTFAGDLTLGGNAAPDRAQLPIHPVSRNGDVRTRPLGHLVGRVSLPADGKTRVRRAAGLRWVGPTRGRRCRLVLNASVLAAYSGLRRRGSTLVAPDGTRVRFGRHGRRRVPLRGASGAPVARARVAWYFLPRRDLLVNGLALLRAPRGFAPRQPRRYFVLSASAAARGDLNACQPALGRFARISTRRLLARFSLRAT